MMPEWCLSVVQDLDQQVKSVVLPLLNCDQLLGKTAVLGGFALVLRFGRVEAVSGILCR